jgi:hypothetical protein
MPPVIRRRKEARLTAAEIESMIPTVAVGLTVRKLNGYVKYEENNENQLHNLAQTFDEKIKTILATKVEAGTPAAADGSTLRKSGPRRPWSAQVRSSSSSRGGGGAPQSFPVPKDALRIEGASVAPPSPAAAPVAMPNAPGSSTSTGAQDPGAKSDQQGHIPAPPRRPTTAPLRRRPSAEVVSEVILKSHGTKDNRADDAEGAPSEPPSVTCGTARISREDRVIPSGERFFGNFQFGSIKDFLHLKMKSRYGAYSASVESNLERLRQELDSRKELSPRIPSPREYLDELRLQNDEAHGVYSVETILRKKRPQSASAPSSGGSGSRLYESPRQSRHNTRHNKVSPRRHH